MADQEDSYLQVTRKFNDHRTLKNFSFPVKTNPEGYPGSVVVDGQTLKIRASDLSVITLPQIFPPPPPQTLQDVTTVGNTTNVGIVMSGPGTLDINGTALTVPSGNVTINSGTLSSLAVGTTASSLLVTGSCFVQNTLTVSGATQKIYTNSGSLRLESAGFISLDIGSNNMNFPQAVNFQGSNSIEVGVDSDFFIRPSPIGDIFLRPTPGNTVYFQSFGASSIQSFILNNAMWYTSGVQPTLTAGQGVNPSSLALSTLSNQTCGKIHIELNSLPTYFEVTLNLPRTPTVLGNIRCMITGADNNYDFMSVKLRVSSTTSNTVVFRGNPKTFPVTVVWYYFIVSAV